MSVAFDIKNTVQTTETHSSTLTCPDLDARSRAEQPELERSYVAVSPPLPGMLHIPLVYIRAFALVSHVSVATVFSLYEDEGWPVGRESCLFVQLVIGSRL